MVVDGSSTGKRAGRWSATRARAEVPLMIAYAIDAMQLSLPNAAMYIVLYKSLHASPEEIASYYASIFVPWTIKLVYAWTSDAVPVFGMRRRPWLLVYNLIASACFFATGLWVESYNTALAAGVATQVCLCGSEVMLDSLVVDRVVDGAASAPGTARAGGGRHGTAHLRASPPCSPDEDGGSGGRRLLASARHSPQRSPARVPQRGGNGGLDGDTCSPCGGVTMRPCDVPLLQHVEVERSADAGDGARRTDRNGAAVSGTGSSGGAVIGALQANCLMARYLGTTVATVASVGALAAGASPRALVAWTAVLPLMTATLAVVAIRERRVANSCARATKRADLGASLAGEASPLLSVCTLLRRLIRAVIIGDPVPLWPLLLLVFVLKAVPSTTAVLPGFYLDVVGMKSWEYSLVDAVQAAGSAVGCALYARYMSRAPLWRVLCATTVVAALSGCTQLLLSQGTYKAMHVPGVVLAAIDGAVVGATGAVAFLPVVVLASASAPVGLEATAFAAMLSVTDLAGSASDYFSSLLAGGLRVSRSHWGPLGLMIIVCNALRVAPLVLCWPLRRKVNRLLRDDGTRAVAAR